MRKDVNIMNGINEVVEMMGILRRLETEELGKVLETINTNSNVNKHEVKETLNKKGYEVEICQECEKLYPSEDGKEVFDISLGFVCNGCINKDGYTICHGCGQNVEGCLMRKEDLYTVLETDDFGNYVRGTTCDDFIENYPHYCESCGFHFADVNCEDEEEKGCCPICGEKVD